MSGVILPITSGATEQRFTVEGTRCLLCGGNCVGMPRYHWPACLEQEESAPVGCSKSSSGKAAGESKPEAYPQRYVEDFDEPRTKHRERRVSARRGRAGEKSDFFSILLEEECDGE